MALNILNTLNFSFVIFWVLGLPTPDGLKNGLNGTFSRNLYYRNIVMPFLHLLNRLAEVVLHIEGRAYPLMCIISFFLFSYSVKEISIIVGIG